MSAVTFSEFSDAVDNLSPVQLAEAERDAVRPPRKPRGPRKLVAGTKRWMANEWRNGVKNIQKNGWCQGRYKNSDGKMCALGSLSHPAQDKDFSVRTSVARAITGEELCNTVKYNDAPGRTKEEVIRYMRAVAYAHEHGGKFPAWVNRIVAERESAGITPKDGPICSALKRAAASLTEENWHKGSYFAEKNGKLCMCAHGAVQAQVNQRVIDALGINYRSETFAANAAAYGVAAAANAAAPGAAATAVVAGGALMNVFGAMPSWVKLDKLEAHYVMGMAGLTVGYNDEPKTTLPMVLEKLGKAAELAKELGV